MDDYIAIVKHYKQYLTKTLNERLLSRQIRSYLTYLKINEQYFVYSNPYYGYGIE